MTKRILTGVAMMAVSAVWAQAQAQTPAATAVAAEPLWKTTVAAGANVTRGNSETMLLNGSVISAFKQEGNEARVGVEANYGENQVTQGSGTNETKKTDTSVNNARVFGEYRRLLSERTYAYGNAELLQDDIANIDYRAMVGPGIGRYFVMDTRQKLSAETGLTYIKTKQGGVTDDTVALRVAERYDLKVGTSAAVWESVEYLPSVDDFSQCLINAELGVEAAMNARLSLRVVLQDKYNSAPATGKDENDLAVVAGLSYKL